MRKELKGKVVYLENVAAFLICEGGKKDPVTPTGWQYYRDHSVEVDDWLENSGRRARPSPSGQTPY
jgi:hypothetical protein